MQTSISLQEGPQGLERKRFRSFRLKILVRRPGCAAANCARSMPEGTSGRHPTLAQGPREASTLSPSQPASVCNSRRSACCTAVGVTSGS